MKLLKQAYETYLLKRHFNKLPINYLHYNLPRNGIIVDIFSQIEWLTVRRWVDYQSGGVERPLPPRAQ